MSDHEHSAEEMRQYMNHLIHESRKVWEEVVVPLIPEAPETIMGVAASADFMLRTMRELAEEHIPASQAMPVVMACMTALHEWSHELLPPEAKL